MLMKLCYNHTAVRESYAIRYATPRVFEITLSFRVSYANRTSNVHAQRAFGLMDFNAFKFMIGGDTLDTFGLGEAHMP